MKKLQAILLTAVVIISCQSQTNSQIRVILPEEFKNAIAGKDVQLLDVRTPKEFQEGAIYNAQNIDVTNDSFETEIQKLDPTKPVYIYCRSGSRSKVAAQKMLANGFREVIDLKGGYLSWKE